MKKTIYLLLIGFVFLTACASSDENASAEATEEIALTENNVVENDAVTNSNEEDFDETSVTAEENLANMPVTCFTFREVGEHTEIRVSIAKGEVSGTQYLIYDDIGIVEECKISGTFVEGDFNVKLELLDPRSGEVIEIRNEMWLLLDEQIQKTNTEIIFDKSECVN